MIPTPSAQRLDDPPAAPAADAPQRLPFREPDAHRFRKLSVDGEYYQLPTLGEPVKIRKVGLLALAALGKGIPNPLSRQTIRLLRDGGLPKYGASEDEKQQIFEANNEAFIEVGALVMVEPRIVYGYRCPVCVAEYRTLHPPDHQCEQATDEHRPMIRILPDYDKQEIAPEDVPQSDYIWLFQFAEGEASAFASFRLEPVAS